MPLAIMQMQQSKWHPFFVRGEDTKISVGSDTTHCHPVHVCKILG